ncbi:MAG TPA: hypothetical protein VGM30_01505, partial [Puia sp.]
MFYGDLRAADKPRTFLRFIKAEIADQPELSESRKCKIFYNYCRSGYDAENWYEDLEEKSPTVLALWPTFVKHFHMKWLGESPDSL